MLDAPMLLWVIVGGGLAILLGIYVLILNWRRHETKDYKSYLYLNFGKILMLIAVPTSIYVLIGGTNPWYVIGCIGLIITGFFADRLINSGKYGTV